MTRALLKSVSKQRQSESSIQARLFMPRNTKEKSITVVPVGVRCKPTTESRILGIERVANCLEGIPQFEQIVQTTSEA